METIVFLVLLSCAVMFLLYVRDRNRQALSTRLRWGTAVSKYIVAVFVATFGCGGIAALIAASLLVYARLTHTDTAVRLFSVLVDRPYFPFQTVIALFGGFVAAGWLKEGKPAFVWVLPMAQLSVALVVVSSRQSVFEGSGNFVWRTFFNWGCDCSASLLQWQVMFPVYTSIAFAIAASLRQTIGSLQHPVLDEISG
jgi:hypothetical protein